MNEFTDAIPNDVSAPKTIKISNTFLGSIVDVQNLNNSSSSGDTSFLPPISIESKSNERPLRIPTPGEDVDEPREPAPPPQDVSEDIYKELAEEILRTGQIPQKLIDGLDNDPSASGIDIKRLNEMLAEHGYELELVPSEIGLSLNLSQDGEIVQTVTSHSDNAMNTARRMRQERPVAPTNPSPVNTDQKVQTVLEKLKTMSFAPNDQPVLDDKKVLMNTKKELPLHDKKKIVPELVEADKPVLEKKEVGENERRLDIPLKLTAAEKLAVQELSRHITTGDAAAIQKVFAAFASNPDTMRHIVNGLNRWFSQTGAIQAEYSTSSDPYGEHSTLSITALTSRTTQTEISFTQSRDNRGGQPFFSVTATNLDFARGSDRRPTPPLKAAYGISIAVERARTGSK